MFKFFKPKPKTPAEEKIEHIIQMLFPPCKTEKDSKGNKFHVDYSADRNLDAALIDLEEGHNDEVCRNTIKKVANKLFELREYLEVQQLLDPEVKYILVEDMETKNIEKIKVSD